MQAGKRIREVAFAAAGMVAIAAASVGSGFTPASSQELRIRLSAEPYSFDPGQQQWDYEAAVGRQTFEALLKPSRDFRDVAGAAADTYKVDSTGPVYTFR